MTTWAFVEMRPRMLGLKKTKKLLYFKTISTFSPPDAKVIIFSAPTPVSVRETIHLVKLVSGQSRDSSKVAFVTQP